MELKNIVRNVVLSLVCLNAVYALYCYLNGVPFSFEMVHCVVVPVLSGFAMSYGETLRIKRQSKYKNLSELDA